MPCECAVPTLRELQRCFAAAIFADDDESVSAAARACGSSGRAGLGIYRAQLHGAFARTLALEFPVIERLMGGEYFRQLAREFQAAHPSRSGNLHYIGAPFTAFLKQRFAGSPYRLLFRCRGIGVGRRGMQHRPRGAGIRCAGAAPRRSCPLRRSAV